MQKKIFDLLFLGGHHTLFTSHIEIFLNNLLENSLYHPAIEELKKAQSSGAHVVLLSASPDFLVEKIAQRLNIPHWKASNYVIDNDGKFIKIASYLQGNDKAAYTVDCLSRLGIDLSSAAAYTDSILDLPFLETVGHPIAVQPDRQLRAICQRRQWRII